MTDWAAYLACKTCEAGAGEACYTLLARGPQALPSQFADVPHSSRTMCGESRKPPAVSATRKPATPLPARRAERKTATKASGWAAVAEQQRKRRETA